MFNHKTMTESAALELRKAILNGDYPPGTRLVPARLEADLRLSKTAIREAIRELVGTGLVISMTHKGACVAETIDIQEIRDIFDIRYQLEGKAAYLGAGNLSSDDIGKMELLLDEMSRPRNISHSVDFLLNQQFHMILYTASGWKFLTKVINRMFDQVLLFRSSLYLQAPQKKLKEIISRKTFEPYHQDHVRIVEKIKKRDMACTKKAVVDNLKRGLQGLEELLVYIEK